MVAKRGHVLLEEPTLLSVTVELVDVLNPRHGVFDVGITLLRSTSSRRESLKKCVKPHGSPPFSDDMCHEFVEKSSGM